MSSHSLLLSISQTAEDTAIVTKIRIKLPEEILRMIHFAFHSHLSFGIEVCANTTSNHLSKPYVLNNRLLGIVHRSEINKNTQY